MNSLLPLQWPPQRWRLLMDLPFQSVQLPLNILQFDKVVAPIYVYPLRCVSTHVQARSVARIAVVLFRRAQISHTAIHVQNS